MITAFFVYCNLTNLFRFSQLCLTQHASYLELDYGVAFVLN